MADAIDEHTIDLSAAEAVDDRWVLAIERRHPRLLRRYLLASLIWGPLAPVAALLGYLRYRTIRYRFDDEGVTMGWGGLVHREVSVAYERIQDIHLSSGVIERWLGLARIEIQTASGGSRPELTLEGLLDYRAVRDFLYARTGTGSRPAPAASEGDARMVDDAALHALARSLSHVAAELRATRLALQQAATPKERPE